MKKTFIVLFAIFFLSANYMFGQKNQLLKVYHTKDGKTAIVNTGIDNIGYWMGLAKMGVIPYNKEVKNSKIIYKRGKTISDFEDSPDIPIVEGSDITQTENSIFVDPNDELHVLNSNNSTSWDGSTVNSLYGTSGFFTSDGAETWQGSYEGTGGSNDGDPATGIDLDGRMFVGAIANDNMQQSVAYSLDNGTTWTSVLSGTASDLDKNHLCIDNSPSSPYQGNIYVGWTNFNNSPYHVEMVKSTDHGLSWTSPVEVSNSPFDHGVNIQTDADGNVYVVWAEYNNSPDPEDAIGMTKSTDGGDTWSAPTEIISNIKGIREDEPLAHRTNSFPSMTINQNDGTIYVVWANYGVPGTNTGNWVNAYMIKSTDHGATWSTPVQVSQSPNVDGTFSYFPWITWDNATGALAVVFLDNRNCTGDDVETWVALSFDDGDTWQDFRVSDVSWTTKAISGLAVGYMGDYLGISAHNGIIYPVWSDDRTGNFLAYTSPIVLNMRPKPKNLTAEIVNQQTGLTNLEWNFNDTAGTFLKFYVYRDNALIDSTLDSTYTDVLPSYGTHKYQVSALHSTGESSKTSAYVTWGKALISVSPTSISDTLGLNQTATHILSVTNNGELDLVYDVNTEITSKNSFVPTYCSASGGGDEYISGVSFGNINTTSGENGYEDHTDLSTDIKADSTYNLTVYNGKPYDYDDWGVWIDFNQDGDFDDPDENVVCVSSVGDSVVSFNITIPANAMAGQTTMRIRLKYSGDDCGDPCGTTTWGEVEDYSVNILNWLQHTEPADTVHPGETINIPVTLSSETVTVGSYSATLHFLSNAQNSDTVDVPVSLTVVDSVALQSNPSALPQNICYDDSTTLYANVTGGTGNYTYSWSDGTTVVSTEANPVVYPTTTTTYTLTVNDGDTEIVNNITVNVIEQLEPPVKPTGKTTVGNQNNVVKYSTLGSQYAYTYEWQITPADAGVIVGNTDTAFYNPNNDFTGTAYIKVKAVNDCGESEWSDSLQITVIQGETSIKKPQVKLGISPNPNNGQFLFSIDSDSEEYYNIEIYNAAGQKIYQDLNHYFVSRNSMIINLGQQAAGIYILHLSSKTVNKNIKFVIE